MSSNIRIKRICKFCKNEFTAKTTTTSYCSLKCNQKDYKKQLKEKKIKLSDTQTKKVKLQINEDLKSIDTKPYLSVKELCMLLGISRTTLYRLVKEKQVPATKIGKKVIFRKSNIDKLFDI